MSIKMTKEDEFRLLKSEVYRISQVLGCIVGGLKDTTQILFLLYLHQDALDACIKRAKDLRAAIEEENKGITK